MRLVEERADAVDERVRVGLGIFFGHHSVSGFSHEVFSVLTIATQLS